MSWYDRLLDKADDRVSLVIRANAFTFASFSATFLNDAHKAEDYASEAVELAKSAGEDRNPVLILAMGGLSTSAEAAGDYQTAFEIGKQTIQLLRSSEPADPFLLGMSLLGIGNIAAEAGHFDEARELLDEALRMAREAGDAFRTAHIFTTFGNMASYQGNYPEAIRTYEKSVKLLRELDAHHDLAAMLRNLGRAYLLQGKVKRAEALFIESLEMHRAEQSRTGVLECLIGLGSAAVLGGRPAAGVRLLTAVRDLRGEHNAFVWPAKPMEIEPYLQVARTQLNEAEFQVEQVAGQVLSLEQAIQLAREPAIVETRPVKGEIPEGLTDRELEVAALITRGRSNREIAGQLVISPRTVEKHIGNILSKLGLNSRSQIVRWFMEQGVTQNSE
jgi:ATP/maltotriose-dependent transcriptional regulator MalT